MDSLISYPLLKKIVSEVVFKIFRLTKSNLYMARDPFFLFGKVFPAFISERLAFVFCIFFFFFPLLIAIGEMFGILWKICLYVILNCVRSTFNFSRILELFPDFMKTSYVFFFSVKEILINCRNILLSERK